MSKLFKPALLFAAGAVFASASLAAPRYQASVIELEETITDQITADLDGDGRQDLLVAVWSDDRGRELLVFPQGANGHFSGKPAQRIEVKKDIVAFALADIREEAGEELILLTRSGAYSYSSRKEGYAGNLQKLFDFDFLATIPERKSFPFLGRAQDYNADGIADLLLPGRQQYSLFLGKGDGSFPSVVELPRPHRDPRRESDTDIRFDVSFAEGLSFSVNSPSPFAELLPKRSSNSPGDQGWDRFDENNSILEVEHWLAALNPVQLNRGPEFEFVYLDHPQGESDAGTDKLRFNALRLENGKAESEWQHELNATDEIVAADFNGDGLGDLLLLNSRGSDQTNVLFFANRAGKFNFAAPDQVMRFSGYQVQVSLRDLNRDQVPELIVSYYGLAAVEALRSGSMLRTTLIYAGNALSGNGNTGQADGEGGKGLPFSQRPTAKIEDKFSAENARGLVERLNFSADVDADGRNEMVGLDQAGALIARSIGPDLQPASEPVWRFVPLHLIQSVIPRNLNKDGASDFLLRHQNSVTVLVSQP
ncbi:VCBS repeat-containing protein [Proteobacteria bacterium 005FR1]|nr:VCBS repeat-containing protein [Proteobacteria bacterium 005FR1]